MTDNDPANNLARLPQRRDIVVTAALALTGVGAVAALWPFLSALGVKPGDDGETTPVDLDAIPAGTSRILVWRGNPYLARHRTADEAAQARRQLAIIDRYARNDNLEPMSGATEANRVVSGKPAWLIMSALCTKGDCIIRGREALTLDEGIGWMCPCCASRYDLSGRVVSGPAPQNLPVPRYKPRDGRLIIGAR